QITGRETPSLSECDGITGSQTPQGGMEPRGVAVDSSGNVYVADAAGKVVDEFDAAGEYLRQISDSHIVNPGSIAVDSKGNLFVNNGHFEGFNVVRFDAAGLFVEELDGELTESVAVDPASDHIFVDEETSGQIAEFDAEGRRLDTFGRFGLVIAVDGSTSRIYSNSLSGLEAIEIHGPLRVVPDVTTGSATNVQDASAVLNGRVDPDASHGGGEITACEFEYGTSTSYGQSAPCSPPTPYSSGTDVSATVSVAPDTVYHFRLKAANANVNGGSNVGEDMTFEASGPPAIDSQSATVVQRSATVRAQINPFGLDTSCQVQYVEAVDFQSSGYANATTLPCVPADLGSEFGDQSATAKLAGLHVDTTYHFRFIASNQAAGGTVRGADQTFATFGISSFGMEVLDREGHPYTQAGGHPYQVITKFSLNTSTDATGEIATDANIKDVQTELPPGLIGNVNATPRCTAPDLVAFQCSGATQVGVLTVHEDLKHGLEETVIPIYNLVPPRGVPAEFGGRSLTIADVYIRANARTGGDYGITAEVSNALTATGVVRATVELWGVPADSSHDPERHCPSPNGGVEQAPCSASTPLVPFLTNPTSCAGPQRVGLRADSWQEPGTFVTAESTLPAVTGCERLRFTPSLSIQPDTNSA